MKLARVFRSWGKSGGKSGGKSACKPVCIAVVMFSVAGCGVKAFFPPDAGRVGAPEPQPGPAAPPPADASGATSRPVDAAAPGRPDGLSGAPPPSPPPPGGLVINGRSIPRERAVVFIHVGHSDMAGRADQPSNLRPFFTETHPQLWVYAAGGSFRPAREPTAGDSGSAGKAGPGMAILKTAVAGAPETVFISIGHGHSGAAGGYCPNFRRGKLIWPTFMDAARELKGKVTFGGLFTMFGITEYHVPDGPAQVGDCIIGLAGEIREELEAPDMPLMVGGWNMGGTGIYSPTGEYGRLARPALERVPSRDPRAALIPTDGLAMQDDRHLNLAGHKAWAERAFSILMAKGWLPWTSPQ